ncbi:DUF1028 domain-containing protein [Streptomyces sp. NPDC055078]
MTFSILATDTTGAIGAAICSSSPAVAARCLNLRDGVGGANSQSVTDPRLGPRLLDLLGQGLCAEEALSSVVAAEPNARYRQLLVIGADGRSAVFSGRQALGVHGEAQGPRSVAAGNLLAGPNVVQALVEGFETGTGDLELRLLNGLSAALAAGGEAGPVRSAGVSVVRDAGWRVTDLRVDWHDQPVHELRRLLELWLPQREDYVTRGIEPSRAPSYGVPGDE